MWRINPDNPNHYIIGGFAEGIDALQVASDFDQLLARSRNR
jgi:hypothetical protein